MRAARRSVTAAMIPALLLSACGSAPGTATDSRNADPAGITAENGADYNQAAPVQAGEQPREPRWFQRDDPGGNLALYGQAGGQGQFAIRCDRRGQRLLFQRAGTADDASDLVLTIDGTEARLPARGRSGGTPRIEASAPLGDAIVDRLLAAGSIAVSGSGTQPIDLPADSIVRGVIETCRAPALPEMPDDAPHEARFNGTLPCPDCDGIAVSLNLRSTGKDVERFKLVRTRQGGGAPEVTEGSVAIISDDSPPVYMLMPDDGSTPIYLARTAPDRFVFRTADNRPDPALSASPITGSR